MTTFTAVTSAIAALASLTAACLCIWSIPHHKMGRKEKRNHRRTGQ